MMVYDTDWENFVLTSVRPFMMLTSCSDQNIGSNLMSVRISVLKRYPIGVAVNIYFIVVCRNVHNYANEVKC